MASISAEWLRFNIVQIFAIYDEFLGIYSQSNAG